MKNRFRGLGRVFSFTFRRQLAQPGYRRLTILLALLCLLLPALLLRLTAAPAGGAAEDVPLCAAREIVVLDRTEGEPVALGWLNDLRPEGWPSADYTSADASHGGADVLLVTLERAESGDFTLAVTVPEGSGLTQADADAYASFLSGYADNILRAKAGLAPFETADEETLADAAYSVLAMLVPYLCLMVLYFMVLFYGQSVAGCVLMEKTSKLMDFFLVTVEPAAMVLGKILATALAGILQMAVWLASLAGGVALGTAFARAAVPGQTPAAVQVMESLAQLTGLFSLPALLLAAAIILAGFLMYCSLSAIGGSLAGKAEDLGTTNVLFSMVLVASFLACIIAGGMDGSAAGAAWLDWVPFTAVLIAPAHVLLGELTFAQGAAICALVLVCAVAIAWLAGRIYRMMSLYKGNPPSIQKALRMIREN